MVVFVMTCLLMVVLSLLSFVFFALIDSFYLVSRWKCLLFIQYFSAIGIFNLCLKSGLGRF
jgi:hypothetical protein